MNGEELDLAVARLAEGDVVAVPTDTVYGLAVDPSIPGAPSRLFALKRRPDAVALPVLVDSLEGALPLVDALDRAALEAVGTRLWPGPLTIVVRRDRSVGFELGGDERTIGLRCPAHGVLRRLCALRGPLAVSSANRHGGAPCTTPDELRAAFGDDLAIIDGGTCAGDPSTVVVLGDGPPRLVRAGPTPLEAVERALRDGQEQDRSAR